MKRNNVLKEKSYLFALRIVKLAIFLREKKSEFVLNKQVLRSGTAIGALLCEAEHAESGPDYIHKISIALKEANETEYWLRLLKDSDYITQKMFDSIWKDCDELIRMLVAAVKTLKTKQKKVTS